MLLSYDLEHKDSAALEQDLNYLDVLLTTFRDRRDMRPFLRRFYELAVEASGKDDLRRIAQYLLDSRAAEPPRGATLGQVTLLLFHFTSKGNWAFFVPGDSRPGKRIPLAYTSGQVKEAAARGQQLSLNAELVDLVEEERRAGRRVEIFWSDAASRAADDEGALSDAEWPFGNLDLAAPGGK